VADDDAPDDAKHAEPSRHVEVDYGVRCAQARADRVGIVAVEDPGGQRRNALDLAAEYVGRRFYPAGLPIGLVKMEDRQVVMPAQVPSQSGFAAARRPQPARRLRAEGLRRGAAAEPAVTLGPGAFWMHVYNRVTARGGRYVQVGGCLTIGVAGFVQVGGFGSFSKNYGTAAANLLEAEIVTADGRVRIANACTNADLFWALKGGGGGGFGVVTRLALRTRELPLYCGFVFTMIRASSDTAFRR
jgi:FAD binding domain